MTRAKLAFLMALASSAAIVCSGSEPDAGIIVETRIIGITNCYDSRVIFKHGERGEMYTLQTPSPPDGEHCDQEFFEGYPIDKSWKVPWAVSQHDFFNKHFIYVHIERLGPGPDQYGEYWIYQSREDDGNFVRYSTDGRWHPRGPQICCRDANAGGIGFLDYVPYRHDMNNWRLLFSRHGAPEFKKGIPEKD